LAPSSHRLARTSVPPSSLSSSSQARAPSPSHHRHRFHCHRTNWHAHSLSSSSSPSMWCHHGTGHARHLDVVVAAVGFCVVVVVVAVAVPRYCCRHCRHCCCDYSVVPIAVIGVAVAMELVTCTISSPSSSFLHSLVIVIVHLGPVSSPVVTSTRIPGQ